MNIRYKRNNIVFVLIFIYIFLFSLTSFGFLSRDIFILKEEIYNINNSDINLSNYYDKDEINSIINNNLVPYNGAIQNLNLGEYNLNTGGLNITMKDNTNVELKEHTFNLTLLGDNLYLTFPMIKSTIIDSYNENIFGNYGIGVYNTFIIIDKEEEGESILIFSKNELIDGNADIAFNFDNRYFVFTGGDLVPNLYDYFDEIYYNIGQEGLKWNNLYLRGDISATNGNIYGNLNTTGTIYYGALQSNSPHAFLSDNDLNYTRICKQATDGKVLMEKIEFNHVTNKYETFYYENKEECNKWILKEKNTWLENVIINNKPVIQKVEENIYEEIWTKENYINIIKEVKSNIENYQLNRRYKKGEMFRYPYNSNDVYKVIQSHTSQIDWIPSSLPSLYQYVIFHEYNEISQWIQPQGSHDCYPIGALITYQDNTYESIVDCNVWNPTVYGWVII